MIQYMCACLCFPTWKAFSQCKDCPMSYFTVPLPLIQPDFVCLCVCVPWMRNYSRLNGCLCSNAGLQQGGMKRKRWPLYNDIIGLQAENQPGQAPVLATGDEEGEGGRKGIGGRGERRWINWVEGGKRRRLLGSSSRKKRRRGKQRRGLDQKRYCHHRESGGVFLVTLASVTWQCHTVDTRYLFPVTFISWDSAWLGFT